MSFQREAGGQMFCSRMFKLILNNNGSDAEPCENHLKSVMQTCQTLSVGVHWFDHFCDGC